MTVVTVEERKKSEAARRRAAVAEIMRALSEFAKEHGGKFLIFGSAARGMIGYDSDIDVIVDFPAEEEADACSYVEHLCARYELQADLLSKRTTAQKFLDRISIESMALG